MGAAVEYDPPPMNRLMLDYNVLYIVLVALGLGGDLRINRRFEVRVGIGIGDIENFSIGFAIAR